VIIFDLTVWKVASTSKLFFRGIMDKSAIIIIYSYIIKCPVEKSMCIQT
jgi:hypothetical protein